MEAKGRSGRYGYFLCRGRQEGFRTLRRHESSRQESITTPPSSSEKMSSDK